LDIRVSSGSIGRALRFMDALLKQLERMPISIEPRVGRDGYARIVIRGQKIKVRLTEEANRFEVKPTERRGSTSSYSRSKEFEYRPNGKLIFRIEEYCSQDVKKTWIDRAGERLEDQLNDILKAIATVAAALEVDGIRRQERERQRIQAEIRRYE